MKIFIFFLITIFFSKPVFANITNEIIKKLNETNNITFNFIQETSEQSETGQCFLAFPGNLKCIYKSDDGKEILVKNNSLYIIKHKFKKSYRYPIQNTAFHIILDKNKLLENLKLIKQTNINETSNDYFYEIRTDNGIITKIFFNKKSKILKGWETISYNQEPVKFKILKPIINTEFKEKFILPNYSF